MRTVDCARLMKFSLLVWIVVLFVVAVSLFKIGSRSNQDDNYDRVRVDAALKQVMNLHHQNQDLTALINEMKNLCTEKDGDRVEELLNKAQSLASDQGRADNGPAAQNQVEAKEGPSLEYEVQRQRLETDVKEMWWYLSSQLGKLVKDSDKTPADLRENLKELLLVATQHKMSLMKDVSMLDMVDGYEQWRKAEADGLAEEVHRRLRSLQNPSDCDNAKKLVCSLNKGCGYGCQIHHAAYCLIVAYATQRTMVLNSKGWRYHKNGWEDVFLPVSETCLSQSGSTRAAWPGKPDTQVVVLPIIDTISPRPDYLPPAIPRDLANRLSKLHGHPIVWWIGQILRYLLRPQSATQQYLETAKVNLKFEKPIVGVHIRRTDKVGTEAAYHSVDEYMKHVDRWFDEQEYNGVHVKKRRIYLATDDAKVVAETRDKYPEYEVIGDAAVAKTAGMATRYSDSSLHGIMLDIHLLSVSDHLVCTFSSQVCRVAYELMQTYDPGNADAFTSLDDVYYYGGQNAHSAMAVIAHHPERSSELELMVGDHIAVAGNHWDGYSKGRNLRTNQVGLYPSFKVRDRVKVADFPTYEQVPKDT